MSSQSKTLVGPPGIYDPSLLPASFAVAANCTATGSCDQPRDPIYTEPVKGKTEFDSPTYLSTGNPCLDFFFHVVPKTPPEMVVARLAAAWDQDPSTALKLVCNLRDIRGFGKSDRARFYDAAMWLYENHPRTLALNLPSFAEFGYLKDLLEILYRILKGPDCRSETGLSRTESDSEDGMEMQRKRKRAEDACRAISRYTSDEQYQFLHDRIAELFAELLAADVEHLKSGKVERIGLAAKWCPSLDSSFDRATLICESIACKMFSRHSVPEYATLSDAHYAYRVRTRLRKEVLAPLRKALDLPEVHMTQGRWESVNYSRVASLAMKRYKDAFLQHDEARISEFLDKACTGGAKIPVGALLPHEILKKAYKGVEDELENEQWAALVANLSSQQKFKSCIAICSKNTMAGKTVKVSAALSLLISELSENPWKGRVVTFGERQAWHRIEGSSVKDKLRFARDSELEGYDLGGPNVVAVFDEILRVATEGKLPPEKMVKRVFVFSDMQFESEQYSGTEEKLTDYEVICKKFEESGYGSVMPEIVFWNLASSNCTPVLGKQKGVALLSGYSKNLLKLFLKLDGEITPEVVMAAAISGVEYQDLKVFD